MIKKISFLIETNSEDKDIEYFVRKRIITDGFQKIEKAKVTIENIVKIEDLK